MNFAEFCIVKRLKMVWSTGRRLVVLKQPVLMIVMLNSINIQPQTIVSQRPVSWQFSVLVILKRGEKYSKIIKIGFMEEEL